MVGDRGSEQAEDPRIEELALPAHIRDAESDGERADAVHEARGEPAHERPRDRGCGTGAHHEVGVLGDGEAHAAREGEGEHVVAAVADGQRVDEDGERLQGLFGDGGDGERELERADAERRAYEAVDHAGAHGEVRPDEEIRDEPSRPPAKHGEHEHERHGEADEGY